MTEWEIALRLGAATLIGGAIGLNRKLHHQATGVRTLGLVALGSALIVLGAIDLVPSAGSDPNPVSRVVQGVLTGIGFLGPASSCTTAVICTACVASPPPPPPG